MAGVVQALRSGAWVSRERIVLVATAMLIAAAGGVTYLLATAHGVIDAYGRPLGTDFSSFYAAGTLVLDGRPDAPFDPALQYAREQAIFGAATPFYSFSYPPFFLLPTAILALMPYGLALAVWQAATLAFYLGTMRVIGRSMLPPEKTSAAATAPAMWLVVALAFPAVFINLAHGQNGFLTAGLFGLGLALLDRRPIVAGILFGLLAYKPQLGLMLPLALVAGGHWRTIAAAAGTVAVLVGATVAVLGPDAWHAFLASTGFARTAMLEQGDVGWHKIQSVFAWARLGGTSVPFAYALQGTTATVVAFALVRLWRSDAPAPLKAAALIIGSVLATPFSLDYDLMMLAPVIGFRAVDALRRGFFPWEKTLLAALWMVPLVARAFAQATTIPPALPLMFLTFAVILNGAIPRVAIRTARSGASAATGVSG